MTEIKPTNPFGYTDYGEAVEINRVLRFQERIRESFSPGGVCLPVTSHDFSEGGVVLPKRGENLRVLLPTANQTGSVGQHHERLRDNSFSSSEMTALLYDPIKYVYRVMSQKNGLVAGMGEVLDHWLEFSTKERHKATHQYSLELLDHNTEPTARKTKLGEEVVIQHYLPGVLEILGLEILKIISYPELKTDSVVVNSLLRSYASLMNQYRIELANSSPGEDLLPPQSKFIAMCIELLQDHPDDPYVIKRRIFETLQLFEMNDEQKEIVLWIIDDSDELRRPLALRLTAELARTNPDCKWVVEQEKRRSDLLLELSEKPQTVFDNYQDLLRQTSGLLWAGSWLSNTGKKVGLEIEYTDVSSDPPVLISGFTLGDDPDGNKELRKADASLVMGPSYIEDIARLTIFFNHGKVDFSALHLHLDSDQHPNTPDNIFPFNNTIENDLGTWEIRDLILPTLERLRKPPIDVVAIANVLTFFSDCCSSELHGNKLSLIKLSGENVKINLSEILFYHVISITESPEARLAFLLAVQNVDMFSGTSILSVFLSHQVLKPHLIKFASETRNPFILNALTYDIVYILLRHKIYKDSFGNDESEQPYTLDDIWSILKNSSGSFSAQHLASLLETDLPWISQENLEKIWQIIELKQDFLVARKLVNVLAWTRRELIDEEKRALVWKIIEEHGDEVAAKNLANIFSMKIFNEYEQIRVINFIKSRRIDFLAITLLMRIDGGHVDEKNLDLVLEIIRENITIGTVEMLMIAKMINAEKIKGKNLETALNILHQRVTNQVSNYISEAIRSGKIASKYMYNALRVVEQAVDENVSLSLALAVRDGHIDSRNLNRALRIVERKITNETVEVLYEAIRGGKIYGRHQDRAKKIVNKYQSKTAGGQE